MFQKIKNYLDEKGIRYQVLTPSSECRIFKMQLSGINGTMGFFIDVRDEQVLIFAVCNANVLQQKRHAVAELITRINYDMMLGSFKMDYEDGEIRYSVSWQYDNDFPVSASVIDHNFMTCAIIMDKYLPALMSVNYSNTTPVLALREIEKNPLIELN
ncbi:MAG: YbjN domain-containing protein [Sphingobacteriales bacterium]|nr:MAG: YbjN domain-containing protein [Sphingobacteriales bacterium]